jgi:hypothetical protein
VGPGKAILRGIKLAAYACAGLLVCVLVYNVMSLSPSAPTPSAEPDGDLFADSPASERPTPMVPPPPPLPGQSPGQAKPASPAHRTAKANRAVGSGNAVTIRDATPEEVTSVQPVETAVAEEPAAADAPAATKNADAPTAIVIVRPPERPAQPNRGMRWIKAVGHVLHIGD